MGVAFRGLALAKKGCGICIHVIGDCAKTDGRNRRRKNVRGMAVGG